MTTMPREIADSDGESDLDSPHRPSASPIPENVAHVLLPSTLEQDPFANIEFDKFLSPTQRISSAVEQQDAIHSRSTNSTDQFLREIAQHDQGFLGSSATSQGFDGSMDSRIETLSHSKNKRTFSDIEGSMSAPRKDDELRMKPAKRAKTYGSSKAPKADSSLFSEHENSRLGQELQLNGTRHFIESEGHFADLPVKQLLHPDTDMSGTNPKNTTSTSLHAQYHQRGANSFMEGNIQNKSISRSTMGGYEGINLDFRGAGLSLDMSANPFGSLTQVSLDGDIDSTQIGRFAAHFQPSRQPFERLMENVEEPVPDLRLDHLKQMATSPITKSSTSEQQNITETVDDLPRATNDLIEIPKKKRGRKSKSAQDKIETQEPGVISLENLQSEDPLDISIEQYKPRPSRSRAGTVESADNLVSQSSQPTDDKKRKRKGSNNQKQTKDSKAEQLSSELNLSDPAMIGAPKEMYVPKPSRSRSKKVVEDEEDELQMDESNAHQRDDATVDISPTKLPEIPESTNVKKKPGRKSKVKRAKTSAVALLKSADMYDEDDKDCFIVDEVPAKVKMAPLPDISPVKKESGQAITPEKEAEKSDKFHGEQSPADVKLSIDIPKLQAPNETQPAPTTSEPKKRGRKPKKKPEVQVAVEAEQKEDSRPEAIQVVTVEEEEIDQTTIRPPLTEKDPNTVSTSKSTTSPSPTSSPKKAVHSPLKPASRASTPSSITTSNGSFWSKPRVGLSRRTPIPSLLRKLDRSREPPKVLERKEKLSKRQQEEEDRKRLEAEDAGEKYVEKWEMRGKDGMLLEWDD